MERGSKREVSPPAPEFWACEVSMFRMMPLIVALAFPFSAHAWSATVLDVHDGDTVTVAPMGDVRVPIKLRLYGIDAPELEQKGGPQSRDHLLSLVRPGQGVEVIKMSTDKYGRTVALVATDRVLNADMLEAGQAWAYPAFCNALFCNGWKKLERDAKEARRGLWSRKTPTPPWKWRQKQK